MAAPPPQQHFVTVAPAAQPQGSGYNERYNATGGMVTGIIQLICCFVLIVVGAIAYGLIGGVYDGGASIWSAVILFLPAGILGIISKNRNSCVIVAYMVMSILACIESFIVFIAEAYLAYLLGALCSGYNCSAGAGLIALLAISVIAFLVEFIASLTGSIFCCGGGCCGSPTTTTATTTTVVQYPAGAPVASQPGYVVAPPQTGYGAPAPQYAMDVKY